MIRSQRRWHLRVWMLLGPFILLGLLLAWYTRPSIAISDYKAELNLGAQR